MGIYYLRIISLLAISGFMFAAAFFTYQLYPEELPLWFALSALAFVSFLFSVALIIRLHSSVREDGELEFHDGN